MKNTRLLLSSLLLLVTSVCFSSCRSAFDARGIWSTEAESVPGLMIALEFELKQSFFGREWSGRWEMMEAMAYGDLAGVQVSGSDIEVDITPTLKFIGIGSPGGDSIDGILYTSTEEIPQTYTRVDDWAIHLPARTDDEGRRVTTWDYQTPELIDDGWPVASLSDVRIQQQPLNDLVQKVLDGHYQGLDALLIARGGHLVLEEYFHFGSRDEIHTIQSATKSVMSLVFGMAYGEGLIVDLEQPVYEFFPNYADSAWVKEKYPISLKHALMMSAALDWRETGTSYTSSRNDAIRMNGSGDMYGYVLSRNREAGITPGAVFKYTSGLSVLLGGVLLEATGMPIDKYAEQTLFKKIGIDSLYWGITSGQVHTGGGLRMRARDFLKLGQLVLDKGKWNGEQVISEAWMEESTAFHLPVPGASKNGGYGYQWWRKTFRVGEKLYPAIYASGYGYQLMWVIPDLDLLLLVMHHNPREAEAKYVFYDRDVENIVLPAILPN